MTFQSKDSLALHKRKSRCYTGLVYFGKSGVVDKNNLHPSADTAVYSSYSLIDNMTSHNNSSDLQEVPLNTNNT